MLISASFCLSPSPPKSKSRLVPLRLLSCDCDETLASVRCGFLRRPPPSKSRIHQSLRRRPLSLLFLGSQLSRIENRFVSSSFSDEILVSIFVPFEMKGRKRKNPSTTCVGVSSRTRARKAVSAGNEPARETTVVSLSVDSESDDMSDVSSKVVFALVSLSV
ncbi:hypothetical protein F2Q69_00009848 [Brassica cretica]|uniref:Uncharacterized protein n=1 Tax=Brassica cretica TaxID=69181 RepID=A0A8S9P4F5_BRACR|nr:hypothetical protein F2Q69_00009848 [Brassica cretica]